MNSENILVNIWRGIVVILSIGMLYWFNNLNQEQIKFLLDIYKNSVEVFFGNWHWYNSLDNYYVGDYYIISERCLGLNIIVLIFGLCGVMSIKFYKGFKRLFCIAVCACAAVVLGVFANLIRLLSSVLFTSYGTFAMIHTVIGIIIYLSVLIICYDVFNKMNSNSEGGNLNEEHF